MLDPLLFENYNMSDACIEQTDTYRFLFQLRRLAEYAPQARMLPTPLIVICCIPVIIIILLTVFGNLLVLFFKARVGPHRKWIFGRFLCRVWVAADVTFCTCSVVTICVISVDRYLAVTRPLRYKSLVTKTKVILVMIIIWTFSSSILLTTVRWEQPQCYDDVSISGFIVQWRVPTFLRSLSSQQFSRVFRRIVKIISTQRLHLGKKKEMKIIISLRAFFSICFAGNEIRYLAHSVIFAFFLPASVTLTLYWRIYKLARNRQRALDRGFLMILGHNMNFLSNTISQQVMSIIIFYFSYFFQWISNCSCFAYLLQTQNTLRVHFGKNNGMVEHQRRVLRTHERIAKTLGVVSCSFLFCWLPFFSLYLTNYKCHGCISPIAIDLASWLGYCNSMLNPIIYSFTVREFKRSALRLVFPTWQFAHRCLPRLIPAPPDRMMQRMSRNGNRARNKTRHRSFEMDPNKAVMLTKRNCQKRRQTEPAVFGLQKKVCDAPVKMMIIEEDEDGGVHDDYTDTNGFSTYHETSRRLSDLPPPPSSRALLPIDENESGTPSLNGECKTCPNDNSCSVKVFCDTKEADL
ncbi:hypothetical protein NECAME_12033 [Necator americanus]|uniref:G-protein coupled receptors family 1 profile domain-containing protein n=1 Tax=Necator americanus TaxID=51031 RepID=W2T2Z1_NECAM|nr:hypothetical protein NECAME_12033 [Necator americanus]ETN75934.1 hypothetical protein NECAME_12033 [Necator americanus]